MSHRKPPKPRPNPIAKALRLLRPAKVPSARRYVRPQGGVLVHCIGDH